MNPRIPHRESTPFLTDPGEALTPLPREFVPSTPSQIPIQLPQHPFQVVVPVPRQAAKETVPYIIVKDPAYAGTDTDRFKVMEKISMEPVYYLNTGKLPSAMPSRPTIPSIEASTSTVFDPGHARQIAKDHRCFKVMEQISVNPFHYMIKGNLPNSQSITPAISAQQNSASVSLDAALARENCKQKFAKIRVLDNVMKEIKGHCVVCWAWKGILHPLASDGSGHRFFKDCSPGNSGFIVHAVGWIDFKKKIPKSKKYVYCFYCGVPQDKYLPYSHPPIQRGAPHSCPVTNFIVLLAWHIHHMPVIWCSACARFPALTAKMSVSDYAAWCGITADNASFRNAVEIVVWFLQQPRDQPNAVQYKIPRKFGHM